MHGGSGENTESSSGKIFNAFATSHPRSAGFWSAHTVSGIRAGGYLDPAIYCIHSFPQALN